MRTVFVGIFVLLIGGISLAQTQTEIHPDPSSETSLQLFPSTPQRVFALDQLPPIFTFQLRRDPSYSSNPQDQSRMLPDMAMQKPCYAIGIYLFSQDAAESAPRQTGYTTCVPSDRAQLREVRPVLEVPPQ